MQAGVDMRVSPEDDAAFGKAGEARPAGTWRSTTSSPVSARIRAGSCRWRGCTAGDPIAQALPELERVTKMGFRGCLINPDPYENSGEEGAPPMGDRY